MAIKAAELYVRVAAETDDAEKGFLAVSQGLGSVATQAGQVGGVLTGGVLAALGALPVPAGAAAVGLRVLTVTWADLTGAMVISSGVMGGVATLLNSTLPTAMGATSLSMGLLAAAWGIGWSSMGETSAQSWEGTLHPTMDALNGYLATTIPNSLGSLRGAWERDWAAMTGSINAVSAAFDALVARLSRPLPTPTIGSLPTDTGGGTGKSAPPKSGGIGTPALLGRWVGASGRDAPHAATSGDMGEVVTLLRALLVAVQRQDRASTIELDGRTLAHAMSRYRASALRYDARS